MRPHPPIAINLRPSVLNAKPSRLQADSASPFRHGEVAIGPHVHDVIYLEPGGEFTGLMYPHSQHDIAVVDRIVAFLTSIFTERPTPRYLTLGLDCWYEVGELSWRIVPNAR